MKRNYKIFPRGKAYRDNFDETFGKKPKATFENCVFTGTQTADEAMASLFDKPNSQRIMKEITE